MPKRQETIKPSEFQTFGDLLRYLRERAKLTQRDLAGRVGYHYSYLSRLEKNMRAPDETVLRTRFIPALRIESEKDWVTRLLELASSMPASEDSASASPEAGPGWGANLPASLTPLLGRECEAAALIRIISGSEVRLVTLVGPPGVGKTRLALHIAEQLSPSFADGAVFVNLMPAFDADQVIPTFAEAMNVHETARVSVFESLLSTLRSRNMLIVMDNFEQVMGAAPQLLALLGGAPCVKILVTSREALHLNGEQEFPLSALPVPLEGDVNAQNFPSVQLFLQRARSVKPDFSADQEAIPRVAEICRRLDGLPLAIELAAARAGVLSLPAMLKQLDRRFDWLTSSKRDVPAWRQNLRGAVEWSFSLLDMQERALLSRLSVFSGGWTLEAAEAVCSDDTLCLASDVLGLLLRLVEKSMIMADTESDRFHFLETLREFAREKLKADGALEPMRQRHAEYFMVFMRDIKSNTDQGNNMAQWMDRTENDLPNLRAALTWVLEDSSRVPPAAESILAISNFWFSRSHFTEGRHWMDQVNSAYREPTATRADLLRTAGDYYRVQGKFSEALAIEEESLAISKTIGYEKGIFQAMEAMAILAGIQRDYARAAELLEEVLGYRRRIVDPFMITSTMNNLAIANRRLGNLERAKELYEESISISKENGNLMSLGHAYNGLSEGCVALGDYTAAIDLQRKGLEVRRQLSDLKGVAFSLGSIAVSLFYLDDAARSAQLESASQKLRRDVGAPFPAAAQGEHDELVANLRIKLGDPMFDELWNRGEAISWKEAADLALK